MNSRHQKYPSKIRVFLTHDTKQTSIDRNQRACKVEGHESIDNAQTVGNNHGQTTNETHNAERQWTVLCCLLDFAGCGVDGACTGCCRHLGLRGGNERGVFGLFRHVDVVVGWAVDCGVEAVFGVSLHLVTLSCKPSSTAHYATTLIHVLK